MKNKHESKIKYEAKSNPRLVISKKMNLVKFIIFINWIILTNCMIFL